MLLSGSYNLTFSNTIFLNYFRIYLEGLIVYYCLYNTIKQERDLRSFLLFFLCYLLFFVANTKTFALSSFDVNNYHDFTGELLYGRNAWGFTGLLLGFFAVFLMISKQISRVVCAAVLSFSLFVIVLSISRFAAISFFFIVLAYLFLYRKRIGFKNIIILLVGISLVVLLLSYLMTFVSQDMLDMELEYLAEKIEGVSSDLKETRMVDINKIPITQWFNDASLINLIIGDGLYIGHSIIAHTLISTGIIGFLYYLLYSLRLIIINIRKDIYSKSLAILIVVMFANDFIANSRFIILVNACLYMIIAVFIEKTKLLKSI